MSRETKRNPPPPTTTSQNNIGSVIIKNLEEWANLDYQSLRSKNVDIARVMGEFTKLFGGRTLNTQEHWDTELTGEERKKVLTRISYIYMDYKDLEQNSGRARDGIVEYVKNHYQIINREYYKEENIGRFYWHKDNDAERQEILEGALKQQKFKIKKFSSSFQPTRSVAPIPPIAERKIQAAAPSASTGQERHHTTVPKPAVPLNPAPSTAVRSAENSSSLTPSVSSDRRVLGTTVKPDVEAKTVVPSFGGDSPTPSKKAQEAEIPRKKGLVVFDFDLTISSRHIFYQIADSFAVSEEKQWEIAEKIAPRGAAEDWINAFETIINKHSHNVAIVTHNPLLELIRRYLREKIGVPEAIVAKIYMCCEPATGNAKNNLIREARKHFRMEDNNPNILLVEDEKDHLLVARKLLHPRLGSIEALLPRGFHKQWGIALDAPHIATVLDRSAQLRLEINAAPDEKNSSTTAAASSAASISQPISSVVPGPRFFHASTAAITPSLISKGEPSIAAGKPVKLLIVDHGGVIDSETRFKKGKEKDAAFINRYENEVRQLVPSEAEVQSYMARKLLKTTDFVIGGNAAGDEISVCPNGDDVIRRLWELTNVWGYTLVSGSRNSEEEQRDIINALARGAENYNRTKATNDPGLRMPVFSSMVCVDIDNSLPSDQYEPAALNKTLKGNTTVISYRQHQSADGGKRIVREQLENHYNPVADKKETSRIRTSSIVIDDGERVIREAREDGYSVYQVNQEQNLAACLEKILRREYDLASATTTTASSPTHALTGADSKATSIAEHKTTPLSHIEFTSLPQAQRDAISELIRFECEALCTSVADYWCNIEPVQQKELLDQSMRTTPSVAVASPATLMTSQRSPMFSGSAASDVKKTSFPGDYLSMDYQTLKNVDVDLARRISEATEPERAVLELEHHTGVYWDSLRPEQRLAIIINLPEKIPSYTV